MELTEKIYIDEALADPAGQLRLSAILYLAQEAAGRHCTILGWDQQRLDDAGLMWAVLRHRCQIWQLPQKGQTITLRTWPMPTTRSAYPRCVEALDAAGQPLFQVVSLWVLMDRQKRTMVLPGKSGVEITGTLQGHELPTPASLPQKQLPMGQCHRVTEADLDRNGHMNNVRYLDLAAALLPENARPEGFNLCYFSESRLGEDLQLSWIIVEENLLHLEICRAENGQSSAHRVFAGQLQFGVK